ncbi:neuronal acetylcholine receptor subunit alpha-6-like isoform X2 [Haliotis rubra]|uniref:neuronal acetylcholine receptor subunit alpha-6-like isoform X2 n=1 Tax=Haliotis rubra TaxID=36100 RepID=UPI001EE56964|nr:neuronal acetylcholine receptor subunit alpha-6-like isoform X2 [Haliotis rubra]XP_046582706.1 neuronal acetylcholine receptor subunit alpha-6-like isoform X2 [Haliotis rubra]
MGNFPLCLLFFILIAMASVAAETYLEKYGKLREELINPLKYNYKVRPENETFINITLDFRTLDKLDIASQSLSTTFLLYMSWIDERLTWPSTTDIEYMIYSINEIWTPNLVITNYMDNVGLLGIIEDGPVPLRVSNEGHVVWALREAATTTCEVNVTFYPYDHQTCNIEIMEWAHPISEVDLLPLGIHKHSYLEDGEWSFESSSQHIEEEIGSHNQTYRRIKYTFKFRRCIHCYIDDVWCSYDCWFIGVAFLRRHQGKEGKQGK